MSPRCKKHSDCRKYRAIALACAKDSNLKYSSATHHQHLRESSANFQYESSANFQYHSSIYSDIIVDDLNFSTIQSSMSIHIYSYHSESYASSIDDATASESYT